MDPDTPLNDGLRAAAATLAAAGVPSPRVDAELLAAHLLGVGVGRVRALALTGATVPAGFAELVAERAQRIPLQHLTGTAYFRHVELAVGPGVFIPRPETESVVQLVVDHAAAFSASSTVRTDGNGQGAAGGERPALKIVDLGTGSGAIAAALADEVPGAQIYAVELSELAAAWAEVNLRPRGVRLVLGDLATALPEHDGSFDIVVSNPPYIPAAAIPHEPEVALHDPPEALYGGGEDGMLLPTAAAASAARLLKPGGFFVMEHAEVQAEAIAAMLRRAGTFSHVTTHLDLNGRQRATSAVLAPPGQTLHPAQPAGTSAAAGLPDPRTNA
ncbi:peptide chain release factor N(5)-glutamine methyltransferase [Arthrobacter sp. MSA 4-2]|uniref:peptide chain release factor N(5)-glutamine methyltransferase n=1 Tax=Arthrobacter sp. MSA 4-2 TaxID=2794349 RepID=UPI0018E8CAE4|nr:peptide chain release factor N(5)-glutamine methyltransferase [Arthrobacter sp. MSA 4-2]MBJ2122008.1 peptide chain release factor N(5)-glutamine methyltransferase [Arthrobacter sp. MSA 4-2]